MKNNFMTKLLAMAMAFTVALTAVPVTVQAKPSFNKSQTVYMSSSSYGFSYININNLTSSQTIKASSVQSSNKSVAEPYYLERSTSNYSYKTEYFNGSKPYSYSSPSYSYYIALQLKKSGTANITFNIKGISKTQQVKLTVKKYTNPVKSFKISGISKDLKDKTKSSNYVSNIALKKTTDKNATVKISANSGWKINSFELYDESQSRTVRAYSYSKPVSSDTLHVGKITSGKKYTVYVTFVNTKTGGTISCSYYFNQK